MNEWMVWFAQRTVSYDGSNVDFGNPLYSTMNVEPIDTTPAYGDSDKKYMSGVAEVSVESPHSKAIIDKPSTDA